MKLEGEQPVIEGTDDAVLIADALLESVPVNNQDHSFDPDTEGWDKRVHTVIESMEDAFGIYPQDDGSFHIYNGDSWITKQGKVNLGMPIAHLRRAVELYTARHAEDERRQEAAFNMLRLIQFVTRT
jgi:hypothetical protein